MRTTVAVSGSCRRPEKTQAPVDLNSSSSTWICFQDCCMSSGVIGSPTSPSTVWTDNRYCPMVVLPRDGRASPASHHFHERPSPRLTHAPQSRSLEWSTLALDLGRSLMPGRRVRIAASLPSALALALVMALQAPAAATVRTIPPNHDASVRSGNEAEDAIAVNPTDPLNVVTMSTLPDVPSGLFEGVSFDGGQTWTRSVIGTGSDLGEICCDEQLAFDPYGNLWMTYLLNTNGDILIALSTDGGLTLDKVAEIVPTKPTGSKAPSNAHPKRLRGSTKGVLGDQP